METLNKFKRNPEDNKTQMLTNHNQNNFNLTSPVDNIKNTEVGIYFSDCFTSQNSFLSVAINILLNFKYFTNEILLEINEYDDKYKLLLILKELTVEYNNAVSTNGECKIVNIERLREELSNIFFYQRKFRLNYSDSPIDAIFSILNAFHSYSQSKLLSDVVDKDCNDMCISHKYFKLSLNILELCSCGVHNTINFTNNNFIFDIQLVQILQLGSNSDLYTQQNMLFNLLPLVYLNKPSYCNNFNATDTSANHKISNKIYQISNNPVIISICLNSELLIISSNTNNNNLLHNIFKTLLLIPPKINIETIFQSTNNTKSNYILQSFICKSSTNNHSTVIIKNSKFYYQNNRENLIILSYNCLIDKLLYEMELPIVLFYSIQQSITTESNFHNDSLSLLLDESEVSKFEKAIKCQTEITTPSYSIRPRINDNVIDDRSAKFKRLKSNKIKHKMSITTSYFSITNIKVFTSPVTTIKKRVSDSGVINLNDSSLYSNTVHLDLNTKNKSNSNLQEVKEEQNKKKGLIIKCMQKENCLFDRNDNIFNPNVAYSASKINSNNTENVFGNNLHKMFFKKINNANTASTNILSRTYYNSLPYSDSKMNNKNKSNYSINQTFTDKTDKVLLKKKENKDINKSHSNITTKVKIKKEESYVISSTLTNNIKKAEVALILAKKQLNKTKISSPKRKDLSQKNKKQK